MDVRNGVYTALGSLLEYPLADFSERCAQCLRQVEQTAAWPAFAPAGQAAPRASEDQADVLAKAAVLLAEFTAAIGDRTQDEREELFTRTFDFSPGNALEIGWHLFGDDYNRGALLVRLRDELARHDIPESWELPDHLMYVLPLVDRMTAEDAWSFSRACVLPAVDIVVSSLAEKQNPYESLLRCVALLLDAEFGREQRTQVSLPVLDEMGLPEYPGMYR